MDDSTNHPNILFRNMPTVHSERNRIAQPIKCFRVFLNGKPLFSIKFYSQRIEDLLSWNNYRLAEYAFMCIRFVDIDCARLNAIEIQFSAALAGSGGNVKQ